MAVAVRAAGSRAGRFGKPGIYHIGPHPISVDFQSRYC